MGYALGIDVGTTFSAAAIWRDDRVEVVPLETHRVAVPTTIYVDGDEVLFGTSANSRGATQSSGLAREFKRRLGDAVPLVLSGAPHAADRLLAQFVHWIALTVAAQMGGRPDRLVVTHPANWTSFQLDIMSRALQQVDLDSVEWCSEPEAAAEDFAATSVIGSGDLVLVYDLGGGTFDVALLRREGHAFSYVGEAAGVERLGGIDFDEAVFQYALRRLPAEVLTDSGSRLATSIAFAQLRRACTEAKEDLSNAVVAEIPVMMPGHAGSVRITRLEFEDMIRPMLGQTIDLVRQVLKRADVNAGDLSAVLLIGGASRTPIVSELVSQALDVRVRVDAHPKLVVARGAARRAGAASHALERAAVRASSRRHFILGACVVGLGAVGAAAARALITRDDPASAPEDPGAPSLAPGATSPPTGVSSAGPGTAAIPDVPRAMTVASIEPVGSASLPADLYMSGGAIGGISGLAYDADRSRYFAVPDEPASPRFVQLEIDLTSGQLVEGGVRARHVTVLSGADGQPLAASSIDAEGIASDPAGTIIIADEGRDGRPPRLVMFDRDGRFREELASPVDYHPSADGRAGVSSEGGFAALDLGPGPASRLIVGVEQPLVQDAPSDDHLGSIARILAYDLGTSALPAEFRYPLGEPLIRPGPSADGRTPASSAPAQASLVNRLTELVSIDSLGTIVVLEQSIAAEVRTIRLYEAVLAPTDGASPADESWTVAKRLILDLTANGIPDGNYQGMTLGPVLPDGRRSLILAADNSFADDLPTVFVAYALRLDSVE